MAARLDAASGPSRTSCNQGNKMARVINFGAGPAALPLAVLEQAKGEIPDWQGFGMSVMEVSHRSKAFIAVAERAESDLRDLLAIPSDYAVLFLQGGATMQFALLPMNLSRPGDSVDYLVTRLPPVQGHTDRLGKVIAGADRYQSHPRICSGLHDSVDGFIDGAIPACDQYDLGSAGAGIRNLRLKLSTTPWR